MAVSGPLGCAETYQARIIWRATGQEYHATFLDSAVSAVTWGRTLNDTSEATVTISKAPGLPEECCGQLAGITPWMHEVQIYRTTAGGPQLVWEGPIIRKRENRAAVVLECRDVVAYLDRIVNTFRVRYVEATPDDEGRRRGQLTWIAQHHIGLNVTQSSIRPPDWCRIMDYIVTRDGGAVVKYEKDGTTNTAIWAQYVGIVALRNLVSRGLSFTTVGRSLYLKSGINDMQGRPLARLGLEDFMGDVEVITDGNGLATYAIATSQRDNDISEDWPNNRVGTGRTNTPYGPVELLVTVDEEDADVNDLYEAARNGLAGRYPVPRAISLPDGSTLSPTAPITVDQLVCGERIDVNTLGYCTVLQDAFRLTDVQGTWTPGSGEQITVGMVPVNSLDDSDLPTGPDTNPRAVPSAMPEGAPL